MLAKIKKISLDRLMAFLFVVITLVLFGWYNMTKPRILVLHSYDPDYAWTRDVNIGLNREFTDRYRYQLNWYYMDTKRHPSAAFRKTAGIAARNAIKQFDPDVLIAIDDDAQEFAAKYFVNDSHMKIVFAGINKKAEDYGYDKASNVTGILERLPLSAMSETLSSIERFKNLDHPIRIAYLGDKSGTVAGDAEQIKQFDWSPHHLVGEYFVQNFSEWQAKVNQLQAQADIILVTGYRGLLEGDSLPNLPTNTTRIPLVNPAAVVTWTEKNSAIPLFSGNGFYTEDGGMLAIGTSPYEQGEQAAIYALALALNHKTARDLPVLTSQQFIVSMNGTLLLEKQIVLPHVYEAAARIGNKFRR